MNITIKAIHFDATEKLEEYIQKKLEKLSKSVGDESSIDVTLKLVKPQTANNKEVDITMPYQGASLRAAKTADTFEEATLAAIDSLRVQMEKVKNRG